MVCIAVNDGLYFDLLQITEILQSTSLYPRLKYEKKIMQIRRTQK